VFQANFRIECSNAFGEAVVVVYNFIRIKLNFWLGKTQINVGAPVQYFFKSALQIKKGTIERNQNFLMIINLDFSGTCLDYRQIPCGTTGPSA
jgi:hypothetical protein